jgi:hypothetical protein
MKTVAVMAFKWAYKAGGRTLLEAFLAAYAEKTDNTLDDKAVPIFLSALDEFCGVQKK